MGLIVTTTGWTGASIAVVHADGSDTYTISGDDHNAADVATDFNTWLNAGPRPWAASLTSITVLPIDDGGRLAFAYAPVGTTFTSFTGNAVALTRIAVCKAADGSGKSGTTRGSCSAVPGTVVWERWDVDGGARNRIASWRMGHGLYAHRRPAVELAMDLDQTYALTEGLRIAAQPRTAYVLDEILGDYRMVTVGQCDLRPHTDDDTTHVVGTLDILGGV